MEDIKNYPLHIDAFKAFTNMMNYEINNISDSVIDIFKDKNKIKFINENKEQTLWNTKSVTEEIENIYADINTKLLLDENPTGNLVIPGTIYEIVKEGNNFRLPELPENAKPIIMEMTPPCDFTQKNKSSSRILSGVILDYNEDLLSKKQWKKDYVYKEIRPISIKDEEKTKMMLFDFRYFSLISDDKLENARNYKLIFRAKEKLFADILQKLSAHFARLGLSVIH